MSRARRSGVALHLREKCLLLVWQQADAAGPMSELERAMFIIDRLYPEMPPQHREQFQTKLAALAAAGTWHGSSAPEVVAAGGGDAGGDAGGTVGGWHGRRLAAGEPA